MFLKILNNIGRKVNLRLSAAFSLLFIASSLLLFGITYIMLSSFVIREDTTALRLKMFELWVHYQSGGVSTLWQELLENRQQQIESFIVRVADNQGSTLFLHTPDIYSRLDLERFERSASSENGKIVRIRLRNSKRTVETSILKLADGNILQVGIDVSRRERLLKRVRSTFAIAIIPLLLLSFATGSLIATRTLKPISNLSTAVRSIIDTGNIRARIPTENPKNELGDLVNLFNRMLEKIEVLVQSMKGTLDTVAHDLRTPMTRLRGSAEMALGAPPNIGSCREALEECLEESEHILTMLNTIMDITEAETGVMKLDRTEVNISTLIEECVELYAYIAEEKGITLYTSVVQGIVIPADRGRIRRVVLNLLDNALKYTPEGGTVEIRTTCQKDFVKISVKDTGAGIESDDLPFIWNRLYRGKQQTDKPGLGLGLSFVRAIVGAHGGRVNAESTPGNGSEFSISLPA